MTTEKHTPEWVTATCKGCNKPFQIDKTFWVSKKLDLPKRCKACRERQREARVRPKPVRVGNIKNVEAGPGQAPDWTRGCEVCGQSPVVPITGMCGPCTFGEASTAGGNW